MEMARLTMETTPMKLGLVIQKPVQEIEQPHATVEIEQPHAELTMETTPMVFTLDQTAAWESMDLKTIKKRIEEYSELGYQGFMEGTGRIASQGDELMRIENGGNPIVSQAETNGNDPMYEFNVGFTPPLFSVKTHVQPGTLKIDIKANKPIINAHVNKPVLNYTSGKVSGQIEQWGSLKIDVSR